jgi:hypothetical protein
MARQRVLERAGWTFWRCFASSFTLRRDAVINDLLQTLESLGIEPLGSEFIDNTVWVHSREVDPYAVTEYVEVVTTPTHYAPGPRENDEGRANERQADPGVFAIERAQLTDLGALSDQDVRAAIYSAIPVSGRVDLETLVRRVVQGLGFEKIDLPLKLRINTILGCETGAGGLERDADWQIRRTGS